MRAAGLLAFAIFPVVLGAVLGVLVGRYESSGAGRPESGSELREQRSGAFRENRADDALHPESLSRSGSSVRSESSAPDAQPAGLDSPAKEPSAESPESTPSPGEALALLESGLRANPPGDFVPHLAAIRADSALAARAARLLDEAFDRYTDGLARGEVLRGLEHLGGPQAVEAFARIAAREPEWRSAVATRLARVRGEDAAAALHALVEAESGRGEIAEAAVRALGFSRTRGYVSWLIELTEPSRSESVRLAAVESLGRIADEISVDALARVLATGDFRLRYAAIRALGAIRSPLALAALEAHRAEIPEGREAELLREAIAAQHGVAAR